MKRHNKRGYFSPATIMALLLAALALGLPFIMNGPVNDEDILTPLPTPESTVTTITEDSKITAVPTQKPVAVTTKKRTDVSPKPSVATSKAAAPSAPAAVVSGETVKSVQDKAVNLEKVALGLYRDMLMHNGFNQNYEVSVSGGNTKTKHNISLGYRSEEGLFKDDNYKRYNARVALDHQLFDNVQVGTNIIYAYVDKNNRIYFICIKIV